MQRLQPPPCGRRQCPSTLSCALRRDAKPFGKDAERSASSMVGYRSWDPAVPIYDAAGSVPPGRAAGIEHVLVALAIDRFAGST
jgi:hypothetical protein